MYPVMMGQGFWDAWSAFRRALEAESISLGKEIFQGVRDRDPGRDYRYDATRS